MPVDDQQFVRDRENMLGDVLDYVRSNSQVTLYQDDIVSGLGHRFPERLVVSAVWRLLDQHRLDLDQKLAIIVPSSSHH